MRSGVDNREHVGMKMKEDKTDKPKGDVLNEFINACLDDIAEELSPDYDVDNLVILRFANGTLFYDTNYRVSIVGQLWPRELKAAMSIIDLFKKEHKNKKTQGLV